MTYESAVPRSERQSLSIYATSLATGGLLVMFFVCCFKRSRMPEGCLVTGESEPANPESNASTLTVGSLLLDSYSGASSYVDRNYKTLERETVLNVFYSSRENVNLIHEVLRQVCVVIKFMYSHFCWMQFWIQFCFQMPEV